MASFYAAVSDVSPPVTKGEALLNNGLYKRCGQLEMSAQNSRNLILNCDDFLEGRYVYIFLPTANYLTMCEVKVYNYSK